MTGANTSHSGAADIGRLVKRVTRLQARLDSHGASALSDLDDVHVPQKTDGNILVYDGDEDRWKAAAPAAGTDTLWELSGTTLRPIQSLVDSDDIKSVTVELEGGGSDVHHTYLYVAPGIGGGGGDIQAETYIVGQDNVMDWFFWARNGVGSRGYEAGSFWDAIAAVTDGANSAEAFFEVYADAKLAILELLAYQPVSPHYYAELDVVLELDDPDNPVGYFDFYGHVNGAQVFLLFEANDYAGTGPFPMAPAPDARLDALDWSIGYDGSDFILKVNDGGIKTVVLTPT